MAYQLPTFQQRTQKLGNALGQGFNNLKSGLGTLGTFFQGGNGIENSPGWKNLTTPIAPVVNPTQSTSKPTTKTVATNPSASNPNLHTPAAQQYIQNQITPEQQLEQQSSEWRKNNPMIAGSNDSISPLPTTPDPTTGPATALPTAYDTAKADYTKAYEDYIKTLNPSTEVTQAQTVYNDYVSNANAGITNLEGQGRGIPLGLVRGQQAKLRDQALNKEQLLQGDINISQGNQTARQNAGLANVSLKEKLLGLEKNPNDTSKIPASAQEYEYAKKNGYAGSYTDYQNEDANRKAVQAGTATDAKSVAEGITSGLIPPDLSKNVSFKDRTAVNAILSKNGYNLTKAQEDWTATNKYLATLNGSQQVRLRQAVNQVSETLPLVEQLANQWNGGRFPDLNKVNLTLAKKGVYGQEVQSIATQLEAEIADLTSELGTVYKGGNSSTDESLKLAQSQLSSNWSKKTMLDAIDLAKKNIQYRKNSITNTGVGGIDNTTNSYAPGGTSGGGNIINTPAGAINTDF